MRKLPDLQYWVGNCWDLFVHVNETINCSLVSLRQNQELFTKMLVDHHLRLCLLSNKLLNRSHVTWYGGMGEGGGGGRDKL